MTETPTPDEGCPDVFVLLVATSSSTRYDQDRLNRRLLRRLTTMCGLQSVTTETAIVDKPADEDERAGHHPRSYWPWVFRVCGRNACC